MSTNTENKLKKALDLWVDISGVNPEQTSFKINFNNHYSDIQLYKCHKELKNSLALDTTGITTWMLLRGFLDGYIKNTVVSLKTIIDKNIDFQNQIFKINELISILNNPCIAKLEQDFKDLLITASSHYDFDEEKIKKIFNSKIAIANARYNAFKASKELKQYQFSRGQFDQNQPSFYKRILKFPNLQMAVNFLASHKESIITLALLRDEYNDFYSYFVFLCKNGKNIYVLSDDEEWSHPMQKEMSRRPDRHLDKKMFIDYLPYQLIDNIDDNDPDKHKATLLAPISDLAINQLVWLIMMFDQIHQRFFCKKQQSEHLSYFISNNINSTVNNIKLLNDYKTNKTNSNLPVSISDFRLPNVKRSEITTEKMKKEWEIEPTRQNEWLEKRYEKHISDFILNPKLNLLSNDERKMLKDDNTKNYSLLRKKNNPLLSHAVQDEAVDSHYDLQTLPQSDFGTKEELEKKQKWYARFNKAVTISYYARKEFKERKEEIQQWWKTETQKQKDRLIDIAVKGEFIIPSLRLESPFDSSYSGKPINIMKFYKYKPNATFCLRERSVLGKYDYIKNKFYCPITGAVASIYACMEAKTANDLAAILNCQINDLPYVLQHYNKQRLYRGNSILDNIDPMEWALTNPWTDMYFLLVIPFSKRGLKRKRKEMGLDSDLEKLPYRF